MEEADRQYFEAMERLFSSPEWKIFSGDIQGWLEAISSQWKSLRPDQLQYEQGRHAGLTQVLEHYQMCESMKLQAEADDASAAEDASDV